ncbi:hypothetical protein SISSUDRAFT_1118412 [Sistotremastrum suecicum HHB10207 ss-3]|uniref:BTB domain-containing protein n=1 Tax=Sistotremastrum suecicum HHB10207 ss-3 TaxID=1314776 RepID=A0A166F2X7_9AGAM|nr:hypothetical protein SISSUDRAFT_1118412 [Sistotremastrum suecicum HHB10207 ss-3]
MGNVISTVPLAFPNADLIIRTSDKVEFKVHKNILALISDVFKDMMSFDAINPPQAQATSGDSKSSLEPQLVDITESSRVISNLLKLIYHAPPPNSISLDDMIDLFQTMHKYQVTGLDETVQDLFLANIDAKKNPLRLYAIAKKYSLKRIADTLLPDIVILNFGALEMSAMSKEIDALTLRESHKIWFFAQRRAALIMKAIEGAIISPFKFTIQCPCRGTPRGYVPPVEALNNLPADARCSSWAKYIALAKNHVKSTPNSTVIGDDIRIRAANSAQCPLAFKFLFEHCKDTFATLRVTLDALPWNFDKEYDKLRGTS